VIAVTWKQKDSATAVPAERMNKIVIGQFFPLLYPLFSLLLLVQVARRDPWLASITVIVVFAAVGLRVLIIHRRLLQTQETLEFEATHDALTGLWNRAAIFRFLHGEIDRQKRRGDPVGVIMLDVDHFKKVNDVHGHAVGDQVLREIARRLLGSVRSYDSVGRYGGEEFLVIVPNSKGQDTFASAERLRRAVAVSPVNTTAGPIPVTVSLGVVSTTGSAEGWDCSMLLRLADGALYNAKEKGRNRVEGAYFWGAPSEEKSSPGGDSGPEPGDPKASAERAAPPGTCPRN
jgi:diguanylate cyclase (GGDEF)-like protein